MGDGGRRRRSAKRPGIDVETLWGDDGFVVRFPDVDAAARRPADVSRSRGSAGARRPPAWGTALFAAKFRENAARSLLLPNRRPGTARAALAAAETRRGSAGGRVALRIVPGAARNLSRVPPGFLRHAGARRDAGRRPQPERSASPPSTRRRRRRSRHRCCSRMSRASSTTATRRSPNAARRRWPSISRSCANCSGMPSSANCSTRTRSRPSSASCSGSNRSTRVRSADGIARYAAVARRSHARRRLLRTIGHRRTSAASVANWSRRGASWRSASRANRASSPSRTPPASATRLGVPLPVGVPESLLQPVRDPVGDLALRYARTHAPFAAGGIRRPIRARARRRRGRYCCGSTGEGRLIEGEFRPGGTRREWTDAGVLRMLRRRSLARLRHEVEPVDQPVLGRFATTWQGIVQAPARRRRPARRDRAAAGSAAARVDPRNGNPAGARSTSTIRRTSTR